MKTGFKMLGVCVIGIIAAILVGYLGAKIGDGIGRDLRKDCFICHLRKHIQHRSTSHCKNMA